MTTKINYVSEVSFNIIQCKFGVLLVIHVTKELYKDSLKVNNKYSAYKYFIIIICIVFVTTRTMNTMSANQKPISSHYLQFIRYYTNFILCYYNYYTSTGSPCISKHIKSTKCLTTKTITYSYNILNNSTFKQRIISDYFYCRQVSYFIYLFHFMKNLVKLCAIVLDYLRIKKHKITFDKLSHMIVPYFVYLIKLFTIIVIHISQTSLNNFLDTKSNSLLLNLHNNLFTAANISKSIFCIQSQNVYIKLIAGTMLSKRLSISKILHVFKCIYYIYVCGNLQITNNMCVVHPIILIYTRNHNTRGP